MPRNRKQVGFVDRCISASRNRNIVENPIEMSEYFLTVFFPNQNTTESKTFGRIFFFLIIFPNNLI